MCHASMCMCMVVVRGLLAEAGPVEQHDGVALWLACTRAPTWNGKFSWAGKPGQTYDMLYY